MNGLRYTDRVTDVPNSGIGYMMRYASKYKDVVSLGQGTPLFPTPSFIYDELYVRSKKDHSLGMYSGMPIEKPLKELIAKQMSSLYGFTPDPQCLFLTIGGIGGLFSALMASVQKGDEVIYFDPSYPLHLSQIHIAEAKPVFVSYDESRHWSLNINALKNSLTPHTRAVILTNPNNPTGTVLSQQEVKDLAEIILDHNLTLILDEAYRFLTYDDIPLFSPLQIPELRNNIIACKSFSKEFAMTGWRIGYVYAHPDTIKKINDIHTYFSISPPTVSIVAATIALSDTRGEKAMNYFKKQFALSRKTICERLDKLPLLFSYHPPQGAYYAFPKITGFNMNSFDFAKLLVDDAKVITIPGSTMGPAGEHHLRMSFAANPEVIQKAFDRIDAFAERHHMK